MLALKTEDGSEKIQLSELDIGEPGEGSPTRLLVTNDGDDLRRDIMVRVAGDGAEAVVLARDFNGQPDVWAAPGMEIIVHQGEFPPGSQVAFWARPVYHDIFHEGNLQFSFVARSTSLGPA